MRMSNATAASIFYACEINPNHDFYQLGSAEVQMLVQEGKKFGYRKPRNANGSFGRYFYAYCQKALNKENN